MTDSPSFVRRSSRWLAALVATGLLGAVVAACSSASSGSKFGGEGGAGGGAAGSGGGSLFDGGAGGGSPLDDSGACASETRKGQLVPLDLFLLLDKSGSMQDNGKWVNVKSAMKTFLNAPESVGIGAALGYFPVAPKTPPPPPPATCATDADCGQYTPCLPFFGCAGALSAGDSCQISDYSSPAITFGVIPAVTAAMEQSLNAQSADGSSTTTRPALEGAAVYAVDWAKQNPDHVVAIVLATDGEPNNCANNDVQGVADAAQAIATGNPGIKTFVIGVGSELGALNAIATAGGTSQAFIVDTGGNTTQEFIQALSDIRGAVTCSYQIPVPASGTPDYNRVNVVFTPPGGPSEYVYNVDGASKCDPAKGGWYYDDAAKPTKILFCPATCDRVSKTDNAQVDVQLGCQTISR